MKKTLAIMALATIATAMAEPTLIYGLDFEQHGSANNIATTPGQTAMYATGYVNYAPNESVKSPLTMNGEGFYHVTNTGTFKIDGSADGGIKDASGNALNTTDGFAITLNALMNKSSISRGWRDVMDFKMTNGVTEKTVQVEWDALGDQTSVSLYGLDSSITLNSLFADTWYNLTISFKDDVCSFSAYDAQGTCVALSSKALSQSLTLTVVQGGGGLAGRTDNHIMDNFGIYNEALNDDQLATVVKYEMENGTLAQVVTPEPATATLSLLALAALAARRKRH